MADIGETRTANGETRTWDGSAWRLPQAQDVGSSLSSMASPEGIAALRQYASELISGQGTARAAAGDFGKKEAGGFVSTLNPINQVKGAVNLVMHPLDSATGIVQGVKDAAGGDPRAIGSILGAVVAPKADAALLRGANTLATAVADKPSVRSGIGYGGGYLAAKAMGEPGFAGAVMGRLASPLLEAPAREIANGSGWLIDKLGIGANTTPSTATPSAATDIFSATERAALAKAGYTPDTIAKIEAANRSYLAGDPSTPLTAPARAVASVPTHLSEVPSLRDMILKHLKGDE